MQTTDAGQVSASPQTGAQSQVDDASKTTSPAMTTGTNVSTPGATAQSQVDDGSTSAGETPPQQALTLEQALRELARTRAEAADSRVKLRAYEQAQEEAQRAQMTREERLAADLATAEKTRADLIIKHQERAMRYEAQLQAARLNIVDPDAAVKLLDASRIEYDDDGTPRNISDLLQELVAAKPYLVSATPATRTPTNASPTNPPSGESGRTAYFTEKQIAAMTPQEYRKNKAAIWQAQREGRIRN